MTNLLRRSELAVPACSDNMFDKAAGCGADLVFLDLEDATPAAFKEESRGKAINALNDLDWGRTVRAVRINGLDTRWCHDDVIEVVTRAGRNLDTIIIPKARTARDVWWVDVLLTQLESKLNLDRRIRLEVLIEEVEGLANAEEIAAASDRLDALIFGVGDFSLSQGARVDTNFVPLGEYPGEFWAYARNKVIVAARIAGIDAIDAPYPDYRDLAGYERDARRASLLGYTGKWAIHPDQVPVANEVYAPTADEIARAEANVAAYREAEAKGRGAVGVNGVLVDAAHVKQAEQTLARAALIKARHV
ncbi:MULTISPECIES: HpcH/HpaI aldolase/citrate lyase family protein [Mycobacterium]|uniref:CoA ester lyase n=1 Tax=Mycobacterium intracellulare subsp. chimaera TaxID=222805 RepID=A0A220Y5Q1_MYCIT|nr:MULTISPECIES: CoA ester lyase [Mycobacterium]AFJ33277.1 malyl-CoA lyase [Mycobacterium sp. MOTT36Y]APD83846.1 CoA ester lyase [Mycobacterium intracellulare subsp. chimaera]ARV80267.1 CoA ester lyase [Mycobacterium intracellulare subsp. chimaera]ASL07097.1 malyl-CoA lyase [Mycobacterium intracellulare subsp. chimaera]ASL12779.1 malyl-CoA lyase [Mycobacterium intracellulare subsp. chimaera]